MRQNGSRVSEGGMGRLMRRVACFTRSDSGTVTVESVIILPILLFCLQATFAFFESYRAKSISLKANYAVADYLSRFPYYDSTTLAGLDSLFQYMTNSEDDSWVRVTVVECKRTVDKCNNPDDRRIHIAKPVQTNVRNSYATDGQDRLTNTDIRTDLAAKIPPLYQGEHVIVVETSASFQPTFAGRWTGIYEPRLRNVTVTSPREFDTLCYPDEASCIATPTTGTGGDSG